MTTKVVKFLHPILIDENEQRVELEPGFWGEVRQRLTAMSVDDRRFRVHGTKFYGEASAEYVRIGRIRPPADWPHTIDAEGVVDHLTLDGDQYLFEAAFLVPFGTENRVAFMGPMRGAVGMRAVEVWLGQALDLVTSGYRLELVPEVDPKVLEKLSEAVGVSRLAVKVPAGVGLQLAAGATTGVEEALALAVEAGGDLIDVTIVLSHGHRKPGESARWLKHGAQRLSDALGPKSIEASMVLPRGDGFVNEQHELLNDAISVKVTFDVDDARQLSDEEVLAGIRDAITEFRQR